MLTPPAGLPEAALRPVLERCWGIRARSVQYRPVGWGSHHWEVSAEAGSRWFVTADDLENKRMSQAEPLTAGLPAAARGAVRRRRPEGMRCRVRGGAGPGAGRRAARAGQHPVRPGGLPVRRRPELRLGRRSPLPRTGWPCSTCWPPRTLPRPRPAGARWLTTSPCRTGTSWRPPASPGPAPGTWDPTPARLARLIQEHAAPIRRLLARYDHLVTAARTQPARTVLTHGEPHPGNTMLTGGGWVLIDWDTALTAPPERDLWSLDPGDGSILGAYASLTGSPRGPCCWICTGCAGISPISPGREPLPAAARRERRG